jgi:hypothetical protein
MDDELNLDDLDDIQDNTEKRLKVKNRIEKLSEKVILTSKEKDELTQAKAKLEADNQTLIKERDFFKDFSASATKYPNASEYQNKIWEKVKAGYTTEDAMVSVLNAEGKLTPAPIQAPDVQVEGGSAPTTIEGNKTLDKMTADEKLQALSELDSNRLVEALRGK